MNRGTFRMQLTGDMLFALFFARLTGPERVIVAYVLKESWGASIIRKQSAKDPWPDPVPCPLNLSAIARETGSDRPELTKAKARLLKDNLLMPLDGGYTLNKDVDSWAKGRIEPAQVERARAEQEVKHPRPRRSNSEAAPVGISTHPPVGKSTHPPCGEISTVCENPHTPCGEIHTPPVGISTHPPSDAGRSKTHAGARPCEEDSSSLPELNSKNSLSSSPPPASKPGTVDGDGGDGERETGNPAQDRKARIKAWVRENFDGHLCPPRQLNALLCGEEPEEWIKAALRLAASEARKDEAVVPFAKGHLARFRANGKVDDGPPKADKPEIVKLTPSEKWEKQRAANLAAGLKAWPKSGTMSDVKQG